MSHLQSNTVQHLRHTPLYYACRAGKIEDVKTILSEAETQFTLNYQPFAAHYTTEKENTALMIACEKGFLEIVKLLLKEKDIKVDLVDHRGQFALYKAAQRGFCETVRVLMQEGGANVNLTDKHNRSSLFVAAKGGHSHVVQVLLNCEDIEVNLCARRSVSPLFIACRYGHEETVTLLLKAGANVNLCAKGYISPLYITVKEGHDHILCILLRAQVDVNFATKRLETALMVACENGRTACVERLVRHPEVNLLARDKDRFTALHFAAMCNHEKIVCGLMHHYDLFLPSFHGKAGAPSLPGLVGTSPLLRVLLESHIDFERCIWQLYCCANLFFLAIRTRLPDMVSVQIIEQMPEDDRHLTLITETQRLNLILAGIKNDIAARKYNINVIRKINKSIMPKGTAFESL